MSGKSNSSREGGLEVVNKYVLVSCLEPVVVGDKFEKVPPHLTLLPPFMMEPSYKKYFDKHLAEIAEENLPLTVHAHQPEYFGFEHNILALPVSGRFEGLRIGAFALAKDMNLEFDDTFSFKLSNAIDRSPAMSFGSGHEVSTIGDYSLANWGQPHITDFEGIIEPGETKILSDVQLFCYGSLKKVASLYRNNMYDYDEE